MMEPELELQFLRFHARLAHSLRQMRHVRRILSVALRSASEFFGADAACVVESAEGQEKCRISFRLPRESSWTEEPLVPFIGRTALTPFEDCMIAPIFRRGKSDSALVIRRERRFTKAEQGALRQVASAVSRALDVSEKDRLAKVRARIDQKLMDELRPNDLFYHILHGLRSLTRYDHSSSLFVFDEEGDGLELRAEQISFQKAKSRHVGVLLKIPDEVRGALLEHPVLGFNRGENGWSIWGDKGEGYVGEWLESSLDWNEPAEALICAPLIIKNRLIGLLRIAGKHAGTFGSYESELVRRFIPLTAVAIHRAQRTESLKASVLESERKSAISNLARSVAHDVNNALGSTIPLLQQALEDLQSGSFSSSDLEADIRQSLDSVQFSRRIFAGMMAFAKSAHHPSRDGHLSRAVDQALSLLKSSLDRRGVCVDLNMSHDDDSIPCAQSDLEQLLFNLLSNARDSMPEGGSLKVQSSDHKSGVSVEIQDTGEGIASENLPHIQEPFYSTKVDGHGLGLAICRSIVWEMRGKMSFESVASSGTRVRLWLPNTDIENVADRNSKSKGASSGRAHES